MKNLPALICLLWPSVDINNCYSCYSLKLQDPTEKHFGDVGILDKYEDNNCSLLRHRTRSIVCVCFIF